MRLSGLSVICSGLLVSSLALSNSSAAASLDINLSNESAQISYANVIGGSTVGRTETIIGVLYNEEEKYVVNLGLLVVDVAGSKSPGLEIGVGPNLYYADGELGKAVAVGLGGRLRYKIPGLQRLNFTAEAYYAPDIVAFADADNMYEVGARIGYEVLPTADVYVGYRHVHADFDLGQESLDETAMFGLKISF